VNVVTDCVQDDVSSDEVQSSVKDDCLLNNVDLDEDGSLCSDVDRVASARDLHDQQLADESLKSCWHKAEQNKAGFIIKDGLLYHTERVASVAQPCTQLCLPVCRRNAVMELAHCTVGCHQAFRKTRNRIRLSFYWPSLSADVKDYCSRCEICQKQARVTVWDRVPITAVPRAQYAFQVQIVDCAGPLFPNQKTSAYNYFVVVCDSQLHFRSRIR
jgi:hypothetical protein